MSGLPKRDKDKNKDGAADLKTHHDESHNQRYAHELLVLLVKLLARRAAETDFHRASTPSSGSRWYTS